MIKQQVVYSACVMSSALVVLLGFVYGFVITQTPSLILIHYDEHIASSQKPFLKKSIHTIISKQYGLIYSCAPLLFSELKKDLPGLTRITLSTQIPGHIKINIIVDNPILVIHQAEKSPQLLLSSGNYAPAEHYEKTFLENLPTILLLSKNFNEHEQNVLFNWVKHLPDSFFEQYSVCWHTCHEIVLHEIKNPNFEYIVTTENLYSSDREKKLTDLCTSLNKKNQNKKWRIDLRFKDQYVVTEKIIEKNNILQKKSITKGAVL